MKLKDILSPFTAWKHVVKEPVTIKDPLSREGADRYRGFHKNDIDSCIGWGVRQISLFSLSSNFIVDYKVFNFIPIVAFFICSKICNLLCAFNCPALS